MTEDIYPDRKATVTAVNCSGPFKIVITNADGTVEPEKTYIQGAAIVDTAYIEQPEPTYYLQIIVKTVHRATEANWLLLSNTLGK